MIALDEIAEDARPLIQAFREAGSVSFQDLDLGISRETYVRSCQLNGPGARADARLLVEEHLLGGVGCRVYRPAAEPASPGPGILFFHGGGWVIGDLDSHDRLCRFLASATGSTVIAVDYRLAPEHPFPAAHDDAIDVAAALLDGGCGLVDPARVVVVGDSAGANLAIWVAAASASGRFAHPVRGQVLLYPVTDLTFSMPSYNRVVEGFPLTAASMHWFADSYAPNTEDRNDRSLSPLLHPVNSSQAASFICTVGLDPLADEGIAYAGKAASAGVPVEHIHLPRHAHGLITSAGRIPTGQSVLERAVDFVRRRLAA